MALADLPRCGEGVGGGIHRAASITIRLGHAARRYNFIGAFERKKMAWVFGQVLLALGLAVAIVWWTFPKKRKVKPPPQDVGEK